MHYYKLIKDDDLVGIATQHDFRTFQTKHQVVLVCNEEVAQYVQCEDCYYRANWMAPVITDKISYETIEVVRIEEVEYNILLDALESGTKVVVEDKPVDQEVNVPFVDHDEMVTVEFVRNSKIKEMNHSCNKIIENGVDVVLSDGNVYHFSLTTQDQLNLITLSSMVAAGEKMIPYHADDELCRYYSVDDITLVMNAATAHKTYHVTYFNSLKVYIEALETIEEIATVEYGTVIPDEYQSDILKSILASMTGGESNETDN